MVEQRRCYDEFILSTNLLVFRISANELFDCLSDLSFRSGLSLFFCRHVRVPAVDIGRSLSHPMFPGGNNGGSKPSFMSLFMT